MTDLAAAVPEAQDGRERENRWNDALNEANRRYGGHRRVVAPLLALADAEIAASAAVREGERERLAEAWNQGYVTGWGDCEKGHRRPVREEDLTPNPHGLTAAPSLAAPEGTT